VHYLKISGGVTAGYHVLSPDMWNASPKDDLGQRGVIEQALIGTPVPDLRNPVNLGRLARSFGI
jgi:hydrogenase large subunit